MIYLDNSATTRICPEALETYTEISREKYGNPSSLHAFGLDAERVLSEARKTVAASLGGGGEIVFTASGSEANNLAIFGRAYAKERYKKGKIITTEGEHASVSSPLSRLEDEGFRVARIPTRGGVLDMDRLREELTPDVFLVTMMLVNNETGALYDLAAVKREMAARAKDAVLHADATQAYMKVPFTAGSVGADLITVSSHKIAGPKGVGALFIAPEIVRNKGIAPRILGGGQEDGFRSGTENVPGIAAFATAVKLGLASRGANIEKTDALRTYLIGRIAEDPALAGVTPTLPERHAPHILNITLPGVKSETMLHFLSAKGICVSSGSACSSHHKGISPALVAFGRTPAEADCSLRVSFSPENEKGDVDALVAALGEGLQKLARVGGGK